MNLHEVLNAATAKIVASGVIETHVEEVLTKTIKEIVSNQLSTYGEFGKQVAEAVKESLKLHGRLDLPSYNHALLNVVRLQVEGQTNAIVQRQVAAELNKLLEPPPETIKLSKLVEQYVEFLKSESSYACHCDQYGEFSLVIEKSTSVDGYREIGFDDEPKKHRVDDCDIRLNVDREGRIWMLRFKYQSAVEKQLFAGPLYGFQKSLFDMRVAGTVIEFDVDKYAVETRYAMQEM